MTELEVRSTLLALRLQGICYQRAKEFAEDLQAFLDGKLLSADQKPVPLIAVGLLLALFFVFRALRVEQVKNLGELAIIGGNLTGGSRDCLATF